MALSDNLINPSDVLAYYSVCAEVLGRKREEDENSPAKDKKNEEKEGGRGSSAKSNTGHMKQAAYSVLWYYEHFIKPENLNKLCRAFLQDADALSLLNLADPDEVSAPDDLLKSKYPLNESQLRAIACALESDISIIQGPPGTGKTETILNLIYCILKRGKTVAMVANNRHAINNVADKAEAWATDPEADETRKFVASKFARVGNKKARLNWVKQHPDCPDSLRFYDRPATGEDWPEGCKVDDAYGWEPYVTARDFLAEYPFITSTIHSLKKCFADGCVCKYKVPIGEPRMGYQYDYVIMDEASQCSPLLGMLAMSCAKHLVLVGDDEQLPPIVSDKALAEIENELEDPEIDPVQVGPYALVDPRTGQGRNILSVVSSIMKTYRVPRIFLNEHYRCHPGIIGFCNKYVYAPKNTPLTVKTPDYDRSVKTPIRVRWFEGNYCEQRILVERDDKGKEKKGLSRTNNRQIEIFCKEELPLLKERYAASEELSLQVLSPYRGVLHDLRERLVGEKLAPADEIRVSSFDPQSDADEEDAGDPLNMPEDFGLTIHKAQGQEYDIVYLLPGEDGSWEWPWTEAKPLINVAVSRAKQELVIIASSSLMSEETQRLLVGNDRMVHPSESKAGEYSEEKRRERSENELFLQKLIDYVRDRNVPGFDDPVHGYDDPTRHLENPQGFPISDYAYGFHRSLMRSVFDSVPLVRKEMNDSSGKGEGGKDSDTAPELAFERMLRTIDLEGRGLGYACKVPLSCCIDLDKLRERCDLISSNGLADVAYERMKSFVLASDASGKRHGFTADQQESIESHFDFVIYKQPTDEQQMTEIVLAVEVDGGYHRSPGKGDLRKGGLPYAEKKLEKREECYQVKDSIVRVLGGRVLDDNHRVSQVEGEGEGTRPVAFPSFTLLRLPTNGTAAYEFKALKMGDSYEDEFLAIEEILDEQLHLGSGAAPRIDLKDERTHKASWLDVLEERRAKKARDAENVQGTGEPGLQSSADSPEALSISRWLARWREESDEDAERFAGIRATQVNELLKDAGYLEGGKRAWRVTPAGEELGIVESEESREVADGNVETYIAIRYTPQAAAFVKNLMV